MANKGILADDDLWGLIEDVFHDAVPEEREALAYSLQEIGFPPHIGFNAEGIPMFDAKQVLELSVRQAEAKR